eukprot:299219-Prymnesium_polylepis.1
MERGWGEGRARVRLCHAPRISGGATSGARGGSAGFRAVAPVPGVCGAVGGFELPNVPGLGTSAACVHASAMRA